MGLALDRREAHVHREADQLVAGAHLVRVRVRAGVRVRVGVRVGVS